MDEISENESKRKRRIEWIRGNMEFQLLKNQKINLKRYQNILCFKWGASKRLIKEYVEIAMTLLEAVEISGEIIYNGHREKQQRFSG